MKDRSDDPSHHERTLLPRSYTSLRESILFDFKNTFRCFAPVCFAVYITCETEIAIDITSNERKTTTRHGRSKTSYLPYLVIMWLHHAVLGAHIRHVSRVFVCRLLLTSFERLRNVDQNMFLFWKKPSLGRFPFRVLFFKLQCALGLKCWIIP